jgi:membrane protease YdiL (CAAX protease family)
MRAIVISILKILGFFAIWAAGIGAAIFAILKYGGPAWDREVTLRFAAEAGGLAAVVAALFIMARLIDRRPASTLGLPLARAPGGIVLGTVIGAVLLALPVGILTAMGYARLASEFSGFDPALLGWLVAIALLNCAQQELLVRSYPFQEIWAKYSAAAAVIVTTVLFVALHAQAVTQGTNGLLAAANVALASIMLGIAYLRTGALWAPIGIHFGWNALQGPVLGIDVTGAKLGGDWHVFAFDGPALWTGGDMGLEGGLAGLAGPLLGIVIVMLLPRGQISRAGNQASET